MTTQSHRPPMTRSGRVLLPLALAWVISGAEAAAIGDVTSTSTTPDPSQSVLDFQRLDATPRVEHATSGSGPRKRFPGHDEVDSELRGLSTLPLLPALETRWPGGATQMPEALRPEALLRGLDGNVWLAEQSTTRDRQQGRGIIETLRSVMNVHDASVRFAAFDAANITDAREPDAVGTRHGNRNAGIVGQDLLRGLLETAIELHQRADGRVGFSLFGLGDFVAEIDRRLRGIRIVEETTGWSAAYFRGPSTARVEPPPATVERIPVALTRLPGGVTPVEVSDIRASSMIGATLSWLRDSLLVKAALVLWFLWLLARAVIGMGKSLRGRRRERVLHPALAVTTLRPAQAAAGAVSVEHSTARSHHRRRRRRHRSPTFRNVLKALGLRR